MNQPALEVNQHAVEALAKAMVELQSGFTKDAIAYALISIAASTLTSEELTAVNSLSNDLLDRRRRPI